MSFNAFQIGGTFEVRSHSMHFQLYIAISRVPALENSIARAIVVIARTR